jgi:hypothetical protein
MRRMTCPARTSAKTGAMAANTVDRGTFLDVRAGSRRAVRRQQSYGAAARKGRQLIHVLVPMVGVADPLGYVQPCALFPFPLREKVVALARLRQIRVRRACAKPKRSAGSGGDAFRPSQQMFQVLHPPLLFWCMRAGRAPSPVPGEARVRDVDAGHTTLACRAKALSSLAIAANAEPNARSVEPDPNDPPLNYCMSRKSGHRFCDNDMHTINGLKRDG